MKVSENDVRRNNTREFAKAYFIRTEMEKVSGVDENADMKTSDTVQVSKSNPFDEKLEVGQIRLLSQLDRPTFVALMHTWGDEGFVVTPFSDYDDPATEQELRVTSSVPRLTILQCWNTRSLQKQTLQKSWAVGTLPEKERYEAFTLWRSTITGEKVSPEVLDRTGIPVISEKDIRREYLDAEQAKFKKLDLEEIEAMDS